MRRAQVWAGVALSLLLCGCGTLPAQAAEFSPDEAYALENGLVSVKFDASGGDGQAPSTIYAQPGEGVTLPAAGLQLKKFYEYQEKILTNLQLHVIICKLTICCGGASKRPCTRV